jgi:hypothetical protein
MKEQNNTAENNKYRWMKPFQRDLYSSLCEEFQFKNLTDIGNFLGLNNPYHGAKLIFEAQKQNIYLRKIVEVKRASRLKISELENTLASISSFRSSIENSLDQLNSSIDSIKEIKKTFK